MYGFGNLWYEQTSWLVKCSVHAHTQPHTLTNYIGIYFGKQALHGLALVCVWGILGLSLQQLSPDSDSPSTQQPQCSVNIWGASLRKGKQLRQLPNYSGN